MKKFARYKGVDVTGLEKMICAPKVYYHYDVPQEPSTDEEFDHEPVDFDYKEIANADEYELDAGDSTVREEHTLCLIKPSGFERASEIVHEILAEGYTILKRKSFWFFPEQMAAFYKRHYGRTWFPKAMIRLSRSPAIVMVLAKANAVEDFKLLCGPTKVIEAWEKHPSSLRARFGKRGDIALNAIHASETVDDAKKEILFFFKHANPEPFMSIEDQIETFVESNYTTLLDGLTELCKEKPINPGLWFHKYLFASQRNERPFMAIPSDWLKKKKKPKLDPAIPDECQ